MISLFVTLGMIGALLIWLAIGSRFQEIERRITNTPFGRLNNATQIYRVYCKYKKTKYDIDAKFLVDHLLDELPNYDPLITVNGNGTRIITNKIGFQQFFVKQFSSVDIQFYKTVSPNNIWFTIFTDDWIISQIPTRDKVFGGEPEWVYIGHEYFFNGDRSKFEEDLLVMKLMLS